MARVKDVWTPAMRDAWIDDALRSNDSHGRRGGRYAFRMMPRSNPDPSAEKTSMASLVSKVLKETTYANIGGCRPFKRIPLLIYSRLVENLRKDSGVDRMMRSGDLVPFIKGSTSYDYLFPKGLVPPTSTSGDTDIAVYINPLIPINAFERLAGVVHRTVLQTISQYKRCLDHMFFVDARKDGGNEGCAIRDVFLDPEQVQAFKDAFTVGVNNIEVEGVSTGNVRVRVKSPFESTDVRNKVSRYSFIIDNNRNDDSLVTRVEVPHFEHCETIPLRRTPFVCSHNRSIVFDRQDGGESHISFGDFSINDNENGAVVGSFDLFRIKLNVLAATERTSSPDVVSEEENVLSVEVIDISVPRRNDAELKDFFEGCRDIAGDKTITCWDEDVSCNVRVPTLGVAILDLFKMLFVYPCPPHKFSAREARYKMLLELRSGN